MASLYATGDLLNSSIDAGRLGRVWVRGEISEDGSGGDTDEICALEGKFFAREKTWAGWLYKDRDHWFHDVRAWVDAS